MVAKNETLGAEGTVRAARSDAATLVSTLDHPVQIKYEGSTLTLHAHEHKPIFVSKLKKPDALPKGVHLVRK